jgi:hypothetical protein
MNMSIFSLGHMGTVWAGCLASCGRAVFRLVRGQRAAPHSIPVFPTVRRLATAI